MQMVVEWTDESMQLAVYAGVPAANTAFAEAEPIVAAHLAQVGRDEG